MQRQNSMYIIDVTGKSNSVKTKKKTISSSGKHYPLQSRIIDHETPQDLIYSEFTQLQPINYGKLKYINAYNK